MDNLELAHKHASKGKGWYKEVKYVNEHKEECLKAIQEMLKNKTFHTSEYTISIRKEGRKERKIYKLPYFPDRIVQWALLQVIEPYLLRQFTQNTYSAIPHMGMHKALHKMEKALKTHPDECNYCLKIDVRHYYQSINHEILKQKYRKIFKDKDLLWLLDEITDSVDTADEADLIRLDEVGEHVGIPIGNYMSQYSGNFYLSSFDHWLKEIKHVKFTYRYMDDMVFYGESKEELHQLLRDIKDYLWENLRIKLKNNYQIFPVSKRAVDFVGYVTDYKNTALRKSIAHDIIHKFKKFGTYISYGQKCSYYSYHGWAKHAKTYRFWEKHCKQVRRKL